MSLAAFWILSEFQMSQLVISQQVGLKWSFGRTYARKLLRISGSIALEKQCKPELLVMSSSGPRSDQHWMCWMIYAKANGQNLPIQNANRSLSVRLSEIYLCGSTATWTGYMERFRAFNCMQSITVEPFHRFDWHFATLIWISYSAEDVGKN